MATIQSEREEYLTRIENRVEELQTRFDRLMRASTRDNDIETLARMERAKKSVAEKGEGLDLVLEEAREAADDDWDAARDSVDATWQEYREAVERAQLEVERADELS
jgi:hypothetical protein